MEFDLLSIIFLSVLVLFIVFGLFRGFIKSVLLFVKNIIAIIVASVASKPLAGLLSKLDFSKNWAESVSTGLSEKGEVFTKVYSEATFEEVNAKLKLPNIIKDLVQNIIKFLGLEDGETVAHVLGKTVVYYCYIAICFVVLYFITRLLIMLIIAIIMKVEKDAKPIKIVNRLLGAILYGIIGLIAISGVCYVMTVIIAQGNSSSEWLINTMHLDDDVFTFSKLFYEHNFLLWVISKIQILIFG